MPPLYKEQYQVIYILYGRMGKADNCTGWDHAYRAQRIAFKEADFVIYNTGAGYNISAGAAKRTRRRRTDIGK